MLLLYRTNNWKRREEKWLHDSSGSGSGVRVNDEECDCHWGYWILEQYNI